MSACGAVRGVALRAATSPAHPSARAAQRADAPARMPRPSHFIAAGPPRSAAPRPCSEPLAGCPSPRTTRRRNSSGPLCSLRERRRGRAPARLPSVAAGRAASPAPSSSPWSCSRAASRSRCASRWRSSPLSASPCLSASAACRAARSASSIDSTACCGSDPLSRPFWPSSRARSASCPSSSPPLLELVARALGGALAHLLELLGLHFDSALELAAGVLDALLSVARSGPRTTPPLWSIRFASSSDPSALRPLCAASSGRPCSSDCAICSASSRAAAPLLVHESLPMPTAGSDRAASRMASACRFASSRIWFSSSSLVAPASACSILPISPAWS